MGLLAKLFGGSRRDPPGTTHFVDGSATTPVVYRIKQLLPGQATSDPNLEVVGPSFTDFVQASHYADSLDAGAPYRYPSGRV